MKRAATYAMMIILVSVSAFGQAKWGGIARQVAMGGSNAGTGLVLNPYVWEDPAYMLLNPAYQALYKDYIWMNFGGGRLNGLSSSDNGYGLQNAGINFALNKEWTLGAILSYDPSSANAVSGLIQGASGIGFPGFPQLNITQRTPLVIPAITNVWELLGSYDGSSFDLGFGFMYGSSNNEQNNTTTFGTTSGSSSNQASSRMFAFRAGGIFDIGSGNAVDVGLAFRIDKATDKITSTPTPPTPTNGEYSASGSEIQVSARGKIKLSNRVNLIPIASFSKLSGEPKEDLKPTTLAAATNRTLKTSESALTSGVGTEYKNANVYIGSGVSFVMSTSKLEFTRAASGPAPASDTTATLSNTALPVFNIGGEWWFTDWLAGRAGYYRAIGTNKLKVEGKSGTNSFSFESIASSSNSFIQVGGLNASNYDGLVTLGVGFRFGNFSLDATVSEEALRRGFGLVGSNDSINSFGYLNASFNFE